MQVMGHPLETAGSGPDMVVIGAALAVVVLAVLAAVLVWRRRRDAEA